MSGTFQEQEIVYLIITGVSVMLFLAILVVFLFNFSRNKILKQRSINQLMQINHKEDLIKNNLLTQEAERKRIAKDLHDDIGGKLNVIRLYVNQLKNIKTDPNSVEKIINDSKELIDETIQTTRRISHDLLPPVLEELGLIEATREYINEIKEITPTKLEFHSDPHDGRLEIFKEIQIFRVMQELVSNAIKHAEASTIKIEIYFKDNTINMAIEDDGKGFAIDDFTVYKGLGLKNIKSRIELIGGRTTFNSSPGNGTKVEIFVEKTPST